LTTNTLHKTSPPGVSCVDVHPTQNFIITGGPDSNAIVFNYKDKKIVTTLSGHTKGVTDVLFHTREDLLFTSSSDNTARVWKQKGNEYETAHIISLHQSDVVGISLHATGDYLLTGSLDHTWGFHNIQSEQTLLQVNSGSAVSAINFHPDGLILGTGTEDSSVKVWDIKSQKNVASFEGHTGKVVSLSFSENGYFLATAAENIVKIWDLRKLKNVHSIEIGSKVNSVDWDYSGGYLAVASDDIRVYLSKGFHHITTFSKHTKPVTDVKWSHLASLLVSTSLDRSVKTWGSKK